MLRTTLIAVIILAGYGGIPTVPDSAVPGRVSLAAASGASHRVVLSAPLQLVTITRDSGAAEGAWFQARLVGGDDPRGGPAQMDGAILVVSAVDGPMPQLGRAVQTLRIEIESGSVDSNLLIRFEGTATLEEEKGTTTFPISGSVSPMETNADCLIWDIVGGQVWDGAVFESEGRLISVG